MLKKYHQTVGGLFRILDASLIAGTWLLSYWIRFHIRPIAVTKGQPDFEEYAALTPLIVILWIGVLTALRIYSPRGLLRRTHEIRLLVQGHLTALAVFVALSTFISEYRFSRGVLLTFACLGTVALIGSRLTLRNLIRSLRAKGMARSRAVFVGISPATETLAGRFRKFPELGVEPAGLVLAPGQALPQRTSLPLLGDWDHLIEILKKERASRVILTLPRSAAPETDSILARIKDEMVAVQVVPDVYDFITLGCHIDDFDGVPVVSLNESPLGGWGSVAKRATDFTLSLIALLMLSPILALIALAVKLTSRGPVLYRQERMGLDGRTFGMLKFRSMKVDAETSTGAVWAKPGDDRRTPIGAFLRSTSLDELPQFLNVLVGDMSLVGPRPERPVFVHQFKSEIPHYMLRHKVKAGITGWAQVNGWRGNTSLESRIQCDLYYIRHWSYVWDWKILFLTLWKGFINKNAY